MADDQRSAAATRRRSSRSTSFEPEGCAGQPALSSSSTQSGPSAHSRTAAPPPGSWRLVRTIRTRFPSSVVRRALFALEHEHETPRATWRWTTAAGWERSSSLSSAGKRSCVRAVPIAGHPGRRCEPLERHRQQLLRQARESTAGTTATRDRRASASSPAPGSARCRRRRPSGGTSARAPCRLLAPPTRPETVRATAAEGPGCALSTPSRGIASTSGWSSHG